MAFDILPFLICTPRANIRSYVKIVACLQVRNEVEHPAFVETILRPRKTTPFKSLSRSYAAPSSTFPYIPLQLSSYAVRIDVGNANHVTTLWVDCYRGEMAVGREGKP
jgi:hypothetical protein